MLSDGVRGPKRTGLQSHEQPHIRKLAHELGQGWAYGAQALGSCLSSLGESSWATRGNAMVCVRSEGGSLLD